jgi:hypothetical protein
MDVNHISVLVVDGSDEGSSRNEPYAARKSSFSTSPSVNYSAYFQTRCRGLQRMFIASLKILFGM